MSFSFADYQNERINYDEAIKLAKKESMESLTTGTRETNSTVKRAQAYYNSEQGSVKKQKHLQNSSRTVELIVDGEGSLKPPANNDNDVSNSKFPAWTGKDLTPENLGNGVDLQRGRPFGNDDIDLQMENGGGKIPPEISISTKGHTQSNEELIDLTGSDDEGGTIGNTRTQSQVHIHSSNTRICFDNLVKYYKQMGKDLSQHKYSQDMTGAIAYIMKAFHPNKMPRERLALLVVAIGMCPVPNYRGGYSLSGPCSCNAGYDLEQCASAKTFLSLSCALPPTAFNYMNEALFSTENRNDDGRMNLTLLNACQKCGRDTPDGKRPVNHRTNWWCPKPNPPKKKDLTHVLSITFRYFLLSGYSVLAINLGGSATVDVMDGIKMSLSNSERADVKIDASGITEEMLGVFCASSGLQHMSRSGTYCGPFLSMNNEQGRNKLFQYYEQVTASMKIGCDQINLFFDSVNSTRSRLGLPQQPNPPIFASLLANKNVPYVTYSRDNAEQAYKDMMDGIRSKATTRVQQESRDENISQEQVQTSLEKVMERICDKNDNFDADAIVDVTVNTVNEARWNKRFGELLDYKKKNGHTNVPKSQTGPLSEYSLGAWVSTQRDQYKKWTNGKHSKMTNERIQKLEGIGFQWEPMKDLWEQRFAELLVYKKARGDTNVPRSHGDLGVWVSHQRDHYKLANDGKYSAMNDERKKKLEDIGFQWRVTESWEDSFELLLDFKEKNGHTNVPKSENKSLGSWVSHQRDQYKKWTNGKYSPMTAERIKMLENIGFQWVVRKKSWEDSYDLLLDFQKKNGHTKVPKSENKSLWKWVDNQRYQCNLFVDGKKSSMTAERKKKLDDIGFE